MSEKPNYRELLELSAKAAGKDIDPDRYDEDFGFAIKDMALWWNPRAVCGDGARMEAALGIRVAWRADGVVCGKRWASCTELFDCHGGDKQAARRMASLRVAAAIGGQMP